MKKKRFFKSTVASIFAVLGLNFGTTSISAVWMPTGSFHNCLLREAHKGYIESMSIGYIIDSIANKGRDISSYNPDVADYWENMYELCKKIPKDGTEKSGSVRYRSTPIIFGDDEVEYWDFFAKHYKINIKSIDMYSTNQIPLEFKNRFLKIYETNDGFKTDWSLYPEVIEEDNKGNKYNKWLNIDINTRIKIAKIYVVASYLDMVHIGLYKKLFSQIDTWNSYDELENWLENNVYCYEKSLKTPGSRIAMDRIKKIVSWPN